MPGNNSSEEGYRQTFTKSLAFAWSTKEKCAPTIEASHDSCDSQFPLAQEYWCQEDPGCANTGVTVWRIGPDLLGSHKGDLAHCALQRRESHCFLVDA